LKNLKRKEMNRTIKTVLQEMHDAVEQKLIVSPAQWIDWSLQLSSLWQDLKDELIIAEIEYLREVNELAIDNDCSDTRAVKLAKANTPKDGKTQNAYQYFKYLEGRDKIVKEFIMLAKKRAHLEDI
jgi:hypothetical protein